MSEKTDIITLAINVIKKDIIPFESGNRYIAMLLATLESRNLFINKIALTTEFHRFIKEHQNDTDTRLLAIEKILNKNFKITIKDRNGTEEIE